MKQYPKGKFAGLAKNRLKTIEATKPAESFNGNPPTKDPKPEQPNVVIPLGETKADAPKHFAKAEELEKYDRDAAAAEYRIATRLDPDNASYHNGLASSLELQCKYPEAEVESREAARIDPKDSAFRLAFLLEAEKKYEESETALREYVRLNSDYFGAHQQLGYSLARHGKWGEAETEFREMVRLTRKPLEGHETYGSMLVMLKRYPEGEIELRENIGQSSKEWVWAYHLWLSRALAGQKKWADAETEGRESIRYSVLFLEDRWQALARLFLDQGKLQEADNAYLEGLRALPNNANLHAYYGDFLCTQKRWADAEAEYKKAIDLNSSATPYSYYHVPAFYSGLGDALKGQNKFPEAEAEYRKALHLSPFLLTARRGLPDSLEQQNRLKEAEAEYRKTLVQGSCASADAHADLAGFLARQKRWKEAEGEYRTAVRLDPDNAEYPAKLKAVINAQKK